MPRRIDRRDDPGSLAPGAARQAAFRLGISAEARAAALLILKGYRIIARRWRGPIGEIDLIARRGRLVAFVEVKARDSLADAAEAVTPEQQRRIAMAAAAWLARRPEYADCDLRFDAVLIAPRRWPRHIRAAFDDVES